MWQKRRWVTVVAGLAILGLSGCGVKHTVGDTTIHDPEAGQEQEAQADSNGTVPGDAAETGAGAEGPTEPTEPAPETGQFLEAKGTSYGGEDWVAEIRGEGEGLWLASPFDADTTYAMVRAATFLQGLRLTEEDLDRRRFTTSLAYKAWHGEDEGGFALTMKILTKGFGKDARYRFRVAVDPLEDGGSRVAVDQYREVMEEEPHQDVGDWAKADEADPEITRDYLEGLRRGLGD
ncbi:hypothetical protein AN478_12680 [Thiohalorhabdus denitrificans]|uniref:Lipoprotein n=1 Tax=Thiohalorhabdus denitrificans TaxID=381306 RepID=A0A0P9C7F4_9GAMM|nr:hypothetical protein [Thiohalorhabdus denitrificans]KPV39140.1 hypothetical protein AN478_12680 [Thiohalorhabdus denitrificans]SCX76641.1 hypothetical protein SAMN05661077_0320 [Thiohalorhabdus denitrificans]